MSNSTWPRGILFREFQDNRSSQNFWKPRLTPNRTDVVPANTPTNVSSPVEEYCMMESAPRGDDTAQPASNVLVYYQNVGGINSSVAEYQLALSDGCYDAYAFTETWLNECTSSSQLFDDSFSVYRQDRSLLNSNKIAGGGVLLAVRSRFKSRLVSPPNSSSVEQLWVAISTEGATIFVCVVYIPPDRINDAGVIETHINSLNWVVSQMKPKDNVVILGDFNLSSIAWQCSSVGFFFPCTTRSSMGQTSRELLDAYSTAGLRQMVGVKNENNRSLDLCFVSEELGVNCSVMQAPDPLVKIGRHHPPLLLNLEVNPYRCFHETSESIAYDFSRANFEEMNNFLERVDWNEILSESDANLAASTLSGVLLYAIDQFVPVSSKREPAEPAWSNAALKNLKRAKRAALRRHCKFRTDTTRACYLEANTAYKHLNDRLHSAHLSRLQSRLKTKPKSFWHHVNDQRKESGLPSTMTDGLQEADTTTAIVDMFRSQFSSVFVNEELDPQDVANAAQNVLSFPTSGVQFAITNDAVIAAGKDLKSSTGCGPDGIPSLVIKRCMSSLAVPLTTVFNLSLETGIFPNCWKQSHVFPVFKKGCKRTVSNYRGIASLCATSKLLELIVLNQLVQGYAHYISEDQHGFVPKRSTTSNLTCFTSYLIRQFQSGHQVDAIYTDLSAAFDKMNHQIALSKFDKLGMNNNLLIWLRSYLTGRSMSVKIGDYVSSPFTLHQHHAVHVLQDAILSMVALSSSVGGGNMIFGDGGGGVRTQVRTLWGRAPSL
ncbi:uncharacterized protein LOC115256208 [Aedes albopictus]|uniref:Endonuclease/exonuclease/phosphatase domain-containing protein n=1 Tax=Aedes albopictus TaxID=7160 RepID=A0ABM1YPU6_AEDAL